MHWMWAGCVNFVRVSKGREISQYILEGVAPSAARESDLLLLAEQVNNCAASRNTDSYVTHNGKMSAKSSLCIIKLQGIDEE